MCSIPIFLLKFTVLALRTCYVHRPAFLQWCLNNPINMEPPPRPESEPINQYKQGINCFSLRGLFKVRLWFLDLRLLGRHCRSSPLKPYFIGSSIDEKLHAWNLSLTMARPRLLLSLAQTDRPPSFVLCRSAVRQVVRRIYSQDLSRTSKTCDLWFNNLLNLCANYFMQCLKVEKCS